MSQGNGIFVNKRGAISRETSDPGALVPLAEAIDGIQEALSAAADTGADLTATSISLPLAFAPEGAPDGEIKAFAAAHRMSPHRITLHFVPREGGKK